jgi:hypothetical protein
MSDDAHHTCVIPAKEKYLSNYPPELQEPPDIKRKELKK